MHGALFPLRAVDPARVGRLTVSVADHLPAGKAGDEVRKGCAALLMQLAVVHDEPLAAGRLGRQADDPVAHARELRHVLRHLRPLLILGDPARADAWRDGVRRRAVDVATRIVTRGAAQLADLHAAAVSEHPSSIPEPVAAPLHDLAAVLDAAGAQLYFAVKDAEAPVAAAPDDEDENPAPTPAHAARLYAEAGPIVDALADVGIAPLYQHLLEFLERVVSNDPAGVLLHVARVVHVGRASGYEYDSLAQRIVVRLVERYFTGFQDVVAREGQCRTALLDVLDIFVQAGWPEARQLSYRLDDVYR